MSQERSKLSALQTAVEQERSLLTDQLARERSDLERAKVTGVPILPLLLILLVLMLSCYYYNYYNIKLRHGELVALMQLHA